MTNEQIAQRLLDMAARRSTETVFGWAHPDCETIDEAVRVLRGQPERAEPHRIDAVLSTPKSEPNLKPNTVFENDFGETASYLPRYDF